MIEIARPNPDVGAVITGVDVKSMSDEDFGLIYRTWIEYGMICVRGQSLDMPTYLEYSRRFGRL